MTANISLPVAVPVSNGWLPGMDRSETFLRSSRATHPRLSDNLHTSFAVIWLGRRYLRKSPFDQRKGLMED